MLAKKQTKIILIVLSYIAVACIAVIICRAIVIRQFSSQNIGSSIVAKPSVSDGKKTSQNSTDSAMVTTLKSYYGSWRITKDLGYHGIGRTVEVNAFDVGGVVSFSNKSFSYKNSIDVPYPQITVDYITGPYIEQFDGIDDLGNLGFDVSDTSRLYAKVLVKDSSGNIYDFYILGNRKILLEGDVHHYYLAEKE